MRREEAIRKLSASAPQLRAAGVASLYLFGSTARDEAGDDSDVDIMVEAGDNQRWSLVDLGRVYGLLEDILGAEIDLSMASSMRRKFGAVSDAVQVF
jgi:uncharacterized protein